jgi:phosphonate transport system substrate-binding protein
VLRIGNVSRRRFVHASVAALGGIGLRQARAEAPLRFGTTPVFLDDQLALLATWQAYLGSLLQRPVQFVQRGSYREISELLLTDAIDLAWICGFPYVVLEARLRLIAVPLYQGKPLYRSHLVVPANDTRTRTIVDLRGKVFAYSDPQSNSGYLVPRVELVRANEAPDRFFRRAFFTFGHRKVVEAVQVGLAQGGAVDGYVWDTLKLQHPEATAGVRVAWQSSLHGFPPIVARRTLPAEEAAEVAAALIAMPESDSGRRILQRLNIDGFIPGSPPLFDSIRQGVRLHTGAPG